MNIVHWQIILKLMETIMDTENVLIKFHEHTGMIENPGIYVKLKVMAMANEKLQPFGAMISIETAMDLIQGVAEAIEEYERWDDEQSEE